MLAYAGDSALNETRNIKLISSTTPITPPMRHQKNLSSYVHPLTLACRRFHPSEDATDWETLRGWDKELKQEINITSSITLIPFHWEEQVEQVQFGATTFLLTLKPGNRHLQPSCALSNLIYYAPVHLAEEIDLKVLFIFFNLRDQRIRWVFYRIWKSENKQITYSRICQTRWHCLLTILVPGVNQLPEFPLVDNKVIVLKRKRGKTKGQ